MNNNKQLNWKLVSLVLSFLLGLACFLVYSWTAKGEASHFIFHNPIIGGTVMILSFIALSAPVTSIIAVCVLIFSAVSTHKLKVMKFWQYIWSFHLDILIAYVFFWGLFISLSQSMSIVYLNNGRSPLVIALVLVLIFSTVSLGIKAFISKHWLTQSSALFLVLLVSGALLLSTHNLLEPDFVPKVIAKYPSPDNKYVILQLQNKRLMD